MGRPTGITRARALRRIICVLSLLAGLAVLPATAGDLTALARLDPAASGVAAAGPDVRVTLAISQPVPWRAGLMATPPRLVLDFRELAFDGIDRPGFVTSPRVRALRSGTLQPGWTRLVLELDGPVRIAEAGMARRAEGPGAVLSLRLAAVDEAGFAEALAAAPPPQTPGLALPEAAAAEAAPKRRQTGEGPLVVVLDPGHGGIDPGAERDGLREADLMVAFARELREALIRAGGFRVVLTREEDVFVPLEARMSIARAAGADVLLSLHADALDAGVATGATVYTLAAEASDEVAAVLAERHDRADLLAGVDLSGQGDLIAEVLMDLARTETAPRSDRLARHLVSSIRTATGRMHRRPHQMANFTVLRAPDIPSALVELGFLSSPRDLAELRDPAWRERLAGGIVEALRAWAVEDAAEAALLRQ